MFKGLYTDGSRFCLHLLLPLLVLSNPFQKPGLIKRARGKGKECVGKLLLAVME